MSELRIARGFSLPLDVAGETIALLGKRGSGKTNTGRVLAEELVDARVQTVVLDPVGAWWGLRSSADGKGEGLALPILGGAHGDVPLEPTAGRLLADVVVDTGQSLVLDLSDFSKTQQRQFVVDFAERLYQRKARAPELLHLILEEADEFAPQRVSAGDARMVGAIEQLVRRGRGRGIGLTMITQRSASLNKSVLEQTDVLLAMRTTGPRDRAAIEAWVAKQDVDDAELVLPSLPSLETGEAWVWNPERGTLQRVRVRLARTYDSSSTAKAGKRKAAPKKTASIDLSALGEQIAATVEKAKASDPRELQHRVRELEQQLRRSLAAAQEPRTLEIEKVVEVPVPVFNGEVDRLEASVGELVRSAEQLHAASENVGAAAAAIAEAVSVATATRDQKESHEPVHARRSSTPPPTAARPLPEARREPPQPTRQPAAAGAGDARVSGPQQRILNALAWFEAIGVRRPRRSPLAAVAGSSPKSSGFEKNLSTLRSGGLIDYPERGRLALTADGRAAADAPTAPPTVEALHDAVCRMVSGPQAALLRALIGAYPGWLTREELAAATGYSAASSGFEKNISTLRSFELIGYPERGTVVALPVLFMEETDS